MFVSPAFAQGAGGAGGMDFVASFVPILLLIAIFWFLIFRPQQKRMKSHQAMLSAVKRGDTVITNGGIIGKVIKAVEGEDLEVEISQGMRVKVVRSMIADVRTKADPVNDNKPDPEVEKPAAKKATSRKTSAARRSSASKKAPAPAKDAEVEAPVSEETPTEEKKD